MKFFHISFVISICLLLTLSVSAIDNSFRLDFDGDGRTDIAVYREGSRSFDVAPQSSYWYFLNTQTGIISVVPWGRTLDVPAPADYDNDSKTDTAVFRWWDFETGDTNEWRIGKSSGGHQVTTFEIGFGYHKYSRNYTGDGRAELGQLYVVDISQKPDENCFIINYFISSLDGGNIIKQVSDNCNVGLTPVPGDYNNDGYSEIAVFTNRTFKVWYAPYGSGYTTPDIVQFWDVDMPTPGDYDGDGKTDFAGIKREANRLHWHIKQSSSGAEVDMEFGFLTDKPVPGNYDSDSKTDIAVFRPSDSSWWILNSFDGVVSSWYFGLPTDTPLAMPVIPFDPRIYNLTDNNE